MTMLHSSYLSARFHALSAAAADIWEAETHKDAMPSDQRHLDEFKIAAGCTATVASCLELNPLAIGLTIPAAGVPAIEALKDLRDHGHKMRVQNAAARL